MTTVDPGEGWRLLVRGEVQQDGDEFFFSPDRKWYPVYCVGHVHWSKEIIRRRIEPVDNTGVEVHADGPYIAIEVHRAALAEIERLKAELDAFKQLLQWKRGIPTEEECRDCWIVGGGNCDEPVDQGLVMEPGGNAKFWASDGWYLALRIEPVEPPKPQQPKTETVVFHEVISASQNNRYLHFVEKPEQGVHIPTGRTETREVAR